LCGSQVGDYRSHDIAGSGLRSRVAVRQHGDGQQSEDGNQTKGGNTDGKGQLDKREGRRELLLHLR